MHFTSLLIATESIFGVKNNNNKQINSDAVVRKGMKKI